MLQAHRQNESQNIVYLLINISSLLKDSLIEDRKNFGKGDDLSKSGSVWMTFCFYIKTICLYVICLWNQEQDSSQRTLFSGGDLSQKVTFTRRSALPKKKEKGKSLLLAEASPVAENNIFAGFEGNIVFLSCRKLREKKDIDKIRGFIKGIASFKKSFFYPTAWIENIHSIENNNSLLSRAEPGLRIMCWY